MRSVDGIAACKPSVAGGEEARSCAAVFVFELTSIVVWPGLPSRVPSKPKRPRGFAALLARSNAYVAVVCVGAWAKNECGCVA
jgi:hypothetical protein